MRRLPRATTPKRSRTGASVARMSPVRTTVGASDSCDDSLTSAWSSDADKVSVALLELLCTRGVRYELRSAAAAALAGLVDASGRGGDGAQRANSADVVGEGGRYSEGVVEGGRYGEGGLVGGWYSVWC